MPTDLTSSEFVKSFSGVTGNIDDTLIELMIQGFTAYIVQRTGIADFGSELSYDELYNGNGNDRLFIRNVPVLSVSVLNINGVDVPLSDKYGVFGYFIDTDKRSLVLRGGSSVSSSARFSSFTCFARGTGNVHVVYEAGFDKVPADLQLMATRVVAQTYQRRKNIDQESKSFSTGSGSGTTRYRSWAISPEDDLIIQNYQRRAIV